MSRVNFTVEGLGKPTRLDKVLRNQFPEWGRQAVKRTLNQRKVRVNGQKVWLGSWKVKDGDLVEVLKAPQPRRMGPEQFDPAWLVADEGDLLVVNKPAGLRSQATRDKRKDNLLGLAQAQFGEVRLFHRLDRDTSGLTLLTRPGPVNFYLDRAFKDRLVEKEYLAIVKGRGELEAKGRIEARLAQHPKRADMMAAVGKGGQTAETQYEVLSEAGGLALVKLRPVTGRTHQLRVHLAHMGAPILGDRLYGGGTEEAPRLALHARRIRLPEGEGFAGRDFKIAPGEDFLKLVPNGLRMKIRL